MLPLFIFCWFDFFAAFRRALMLRLRYLPPLSADDADFAAIFRADAAAFTFACCHDAATMLP